MDKVKREISVVILFFFLLAFPAGFLSQNLISDLLTYIGLLLSILTLSFGYYLYRKYDLDKAYKSDEIAAVKNFLEDLSSWKFEVVKYPAYTHVCGEYFSKTYIDRIYRHIEGVNGLEKDLFFTESFVEYLDLLQKKINHPYFPLELQQITPFFLFEGEMEMHPTLDTKEWFKEFYYVRMDSNYLEHQADIPHETFIYRIRPNEAHSVKFFLESILKFLDSLRNYYQRNTGFVPKMLL